MDVVISNCVINLSTDKPAVLAETFRVLKPSGGARVGCIAGALSRAEYRARLTTAGFTGVSVAFTHQVGDRLHSAIITATKPTDAAPATTVTAPASRTRLPMASADSGCC